MGSAAVWSQPNAPFLLPKKARFLSKSQSLGVSYLLSPQLSYSQKLTTLPVNPHDEKSRGWGLFIKESLPAVLANDVVGEVTAVSSGVTDFKPGDHVLSQANMMAGAHKGGLQECCILETRYSCCVPSNITDDEAATFPVNTLARFTALFHKTGLGMPPPFRPESKSFDYKAQNLLIIGGGSNCGKFGVQFAKMVGIGRVIVVASKKNEEQLKALGATHIIDRHAGDVVAQIRAITGDDVLYAYDAVNWATDITPGVAALSDSKKGKLAFLLPGQVDPAKVGPKGAGYDVEHVVDESFVHPEVMVDFWKEMPGWTEKGELRPLGYEVVEGLDAENINGAYDNYRDGKVQGKVHDHPQ